MFFKPNIKEVIVRTKNFYEMEGGGALINILSVDSLQDGLEKINLKDWNFPEQLYEYLDKRIEIFENYWNKRKHLKDDMIPAMHPWFGIAEHSAFIGGNVDFSEETSWHHQLINQWSDFDNLELSEEKSEDRFAVMLRGANGPINISNALRGNDFFTDLILYPEETHRLMDFSVKAGIWILDNQKHIVGDFYGGTITGLGMWIPGNSVGHISEDASVMISSDMYKKFGLPYTNNLCDKYDSALVHVHSICSHNLENIASISKVKYIELTNDPNAPRGIELCKQFEEALKDIVVALNLTEQEIENNLEFLKGRKTIIRYEAETVEEANRIINLVKRELNFIFS